MKQLIKIFLLFYSFCIFGQEKYNHFIYDITPIANENDITNNKKLEGIVGRSSNLIQYELVYNESKAMFSPIYKLNNSQTLQVDLNDVFMKSQGTFYYDNDNKVIENQKSALGKNYIIQRNYDEIKWEVIDSKDTINNFECKKAIYKRSELNSKGQEKIYTITVWFNEDFESDIAPFGLVGLKGLIVKVDFNGIQEAVLSKMEKIKNIKEISPFDKGEKISQNKFDSIIYEYLKKIRERRNSLDLSN